MSMEHLMKQLSKKRILEACQKFAPLGKICSRSQFGGYGLCCEETMFALVSDGELYLRANETLLPYFKRKQMEHFIYEKRGLPVPMQYYRVDEALWQQREELLTLASRALTGAKYDKERINQNRSNRIKDLPNLSVAIERQLWRVEITTVQKLKESGAKAVYLLLSEKREDPGPKLLFALEGAIGGYHVAAMPESKKSELLAWWHSQRDNSPNQKDC